MGYYQGDYYRGDYYQGTPILSALGGALKLGKKFVVPAVKRAAKAVKSVFSKPGVKKGAAVVGTGVSIGTIPIAIGGGKKSIDETKSDNAWYGMGGGGGGPRGGVRLDRDGNPCAKKYGGRGCAHRMNVTNPRALRRSIRRARGFAKLARKVLSFPISRPPKGRALFKAKKR